MLLPSSSKYQDQQLAVLGMGASGMGAARLARYLGASVVLLDDGPLEKSGPAAEAARAEGFTVFTGPDAGRKCGPCPMAILSPGIDPSWPLARHFVEQGTALVSEIEFAFRQTQIPVIAITGTNGKTTTTALIAHLLNASGRRTVPCGNFGTALSEVVLAAEPLDVLTVEVSSFQLELIRSFRPVVAVWMNFAPDHLDRHPDLESYYRAKCRIFENQMETDTAVLQGGSRHPATTASAVTFSAWDPDAEWNLHQGWIRHRETPVVELAETPLRGRHNAENLMAALAAVTAWGLPLELAAAHAKTFEPLRHRCEWVGTVHGREFLNDSKATNVHALESALRGQERPVVLIAGGKDKGLDYRPAAALVEEKTTAIFTIGEIRDQLAAVWPGSVPCSDLESAVRQAYGAAAPDQSILFSPGTSSFDMFSGYAHRGDVFRHIVQQLLPQP